MELRNDVKNVRKMKAEEKGKEEQFNITKDIEYTMNRKHGINKKYIELGDNIKEVSKRLGTLYGLVTTVCLGLQAECAERQAVECLECIAQCVWDIKVVADECCGTWQD